MQPIIILFGTFTIVALGNYIFYRLGRAAGLIEGMSLERLRRDALEARILQQIETAARKDRELWETEIDA